MDIMILIFLLSLLLHRNGVDSAKKSNIIFILADDLDVELNSMSAMKKTNRLFGREGASFRNAFSTSPLCCPSRSSILTGKYEHNTGVNTNRYPVCAGPAWINGPEKQSIGVLMHHAGYRTAFFGKYLNQYRGKRVPPGWDHWVGLQGNSRYYNYTLNMDGRMKKYRNHGNDYFTDVITRQSIEYFTRQKSAHPEVPVFMILSMSAPHGPNDAVPRYRNRFAGMKAPRLPNYNYTSLDKQWLLRHTPPLNNVTAHFTDVLYRKRLQTLLSLDDTVERMHSFLKRTKQLDNTYLVFSSDHGYHLGQFNQVKGKNEPYEADIRIPLYMRGPGIPLGVKTDHIAMNIDLAPTFLQMANAEPPKYMDGTSLIDIFTQKKASGKKVALKEKHTFLIERDKRKTRKTSKRLECPRWIHRFYSLMNRFHVYVQQWIGFFNLSQASNKDAGRLSEERSRLLSMCISRTIKKKAKSLWSTKGLHCFRVTSSKWRTPPLWDGPAFVSCNNAQNNTFWCLRTLSRSENFLYCEFLTGFVEFFNMTSDPYQLHNTVHALSVRKRQRLHSLLRQMKKCKGAESCNQHHDQSVQSAKW